MVKYFDFVFYNTMKFFVRLFLHTFFKFEIKNNSVIPKDKAVLLVGNHTSWIDTLMLASAANRYFWFMTGDFILNVPIMRNIVKHLYIIPLKKAHGKAGIRAAVRKLKQNDMVCIFPEGEITPTGEMLRFRNGVSIIQKIAKVPIIPFYIDGAVDVWSIIQPKPKLFKKISVTFGEPYMPTSEKETEIAQEIKDKVIALKGN